MLQLILCKKYQFNTILNDLTKMNYTFVYSFMILILIFKFKEFASIKKKTSSINVTIFLTIIVEKMNIQKR